MYMDKNKLPKSLQKYSDIIEGFYSEVIEGEKSYWIDLTEATHTAILIQSATSLSESRLRDFIPSLRDISEEIEYRRTIGIPPEKDERKLVMVSLF